MRPQLRQILHTTEARFVVVGLFNTASGYAVASLLYYLLSATWPLIAIIAVTTVANITISYVMYKLFVFRSKAHWFREYLRFYAVAIIPIALSFLLLPLLIQGAHLNPYVAIAIVLTVNVAISYFGHKHVSFRPAANQPHPKN